MSLPIELEKLIEEALVAVENNDNHMLSRFKREAIYSTFRTPAFDAVETIKLECKQYVHRTKLV